MDRKYLFIANDAWFRFDDFVHDAKGEIWWYHQPRSLFLGAWVYFYLAGKTKAVKYEFEVVKTRVPYKDSKLNYDHYWNYVDRTQQKETWVIDPEILMAKFRLVRQLKELDKTTPAKLKSEAKILGSLMSSRELKPYAVVYLDGVK